MSLIVATSIDEIVDAMANGARPIAGGSDLVVGARHGKVALPDSLVAIDRVPALSTIEPTETGIRIGAGVTHATLMDDPTIVGQYTAVADASALVGSPSTRNVGTLGGNVMNGSPAMDTGAPVAVLGGVVELRSRARTRLVPVHDLWVRPGRTSADPHELCVAIHLEALPALAGSAYVRLEYRRAMEIAVVGAAATVTLEPDGTVASGRVALTAVAPTIIELGDAASVLAGKSPDDAAQTIAEMASEQALPISDLRGSDRYRRHTVGVMASRAVLAAARRASGERLEVPVNRSVGIGAQR